MVREAELIFGIWKIFYFSFSGTVLHSMRILFCFTIHSGSKMLGIIILRHDAVLFSLRYESLRYSIQITLEMDL